ncbi:transcription factor cwo isoform X2 [Phymastichus coffea]|uniref:transcription factor cwo isoform X2 n=1 Tax=Phymastichus coffea TaxID=108790 RepID=UPI00273CE527|nr:transcription factor cwo isoform X2 [Phymastichus coffea]
MVTHSMENILSMQYYAPVSDEALHSPPARKKRCVAKEQDPMSHRIIEKRRRDRMNNCLADLSRLIPAEYLKKGRGRVEKTEIIEMAIRHMKYLQGVRQDTKHHTPVSSVHNVHGEDSVDSVTHPSVSAASAAEHYRLGYQECLSETMHFLVEAEGFYARDALCVQLISHLQQHCEKILATSDRLGFPHPVDLPTSNGTACNGVSPFAHVNGGLPTSTCPTNNSISNGLGLLNNNNNNNSSTLNDNSSSHPLLHNGNSSSDRCSSSGVSSFDSTESTRPQRPLLIPPPSLVSDDSNHSTHSQVSCHQPMQLDTKPPTNYKFKNSIKQRFSADQRIKTSASPPPSASSSEASPKHQATVTHQGVPIFALHDNGGFYIPLTVEASMLRPHMGYTADLGPETVLHPVTISVNFNHSMPPAWSHQSPTHQI